MLYKWGLAEESQRKPVLYPTTVPAGAEKQRKYSLKVKPGHQAGHYLAGKQKGGPGGRSTYSSLRRSPCGKQVLRISVMLFKPRSNTSKDKYAFS